MGISVSCGIGPCDIGAKLFLPTDAPGLQLWLDAIRQTGFVNGDPVGTATDFSGNGRDASAAGAVRPTFRPTGWTNGTAAFEFAGGQALTTAASFALTTFSVFVVSKLSAGGILVEHSTNAGLGNGHYLFGSSGGPSLYINRGSAQSGRDAAAGWGISNAAQVIRHDFDGTHAGSVLYVNSLSATSTSTNTFSADPGTGSSTALTMTLGARAGAGAFTTTGLYQTLLVYSPILSAGMSAMVMGYLASRASLILV